LIDFNVRAERMGWLPSAPQLSENPLTVAKAAKAAGKEPIPYAVDALPISFRAIFSSGARTSWVPAERGTSIS